MFVSGNIKTAITNLKQSKWRSLFTMMGIIVGVSSVITIISFGEGLKQQIGGQIDQLGSDVVSVRSGRLVNRSAGGEINSVNLLAFLSTSTLTNKDVSSIKNLPAVEAVVPINFVTSSAKTDSKKSDNLFVVGTSAQMPNVLHQKVEYGAFFEPDESDENFAVIGSDVAIQLFGQQNPVGQTIQIEGENFIVHAVLAPTSGGLLSIAATDFNSAVFIPTIPAERLTNGQTNILQILLKSKNGNLDTTVKDVRKVLLKNHEGLENFTVLKQYELLDIAGDTVSIITRFVSAIAAISLLVGGISIMDIMWVSVSERTREIGIRKAIGATNRQILNQFLIEGSALCIVGGIIGIALAYAINLLLKIYTDFDPIITLPTIIIAVVVSVAVGILFSVVPAFKAARKNPIDALRGGSE